jgi:hypothetical protein
MKHIAIIGAGPIGIEAALGFRAAGYTVTLYERNDIAANLRAWGFVRMFTPWRMNITDLGRSTLAAEGMWRNLNLEHCPTGAELREDYLLPLAQTPLLHDVIRPHSQVITIGKDEYGKSDAIGSPARAESPFRILLHDAGGREHVEQADVVLDCSGTYGVHRWAGRGGIPAPGEASLQKQIWYTLPDILGQHRALFAARHTLLLGAGYSAATALFNLEALHREHPQTRVSWAIRRPGLALQALQDDPLEPRRQLVRRSLELTTSPPPWMRFLGTAVLESIDHDTHFNVTLKQLQTDLALTVDQVIALVGYRPDSSIYDQLQVHQCYATAGPMKFARALLGKGTNDCLDAGDDLDADTLTNPEPNFFILGAKSFGTNSNFLLQVGHRQIEQVQALLAASSPA